MKVVKKYCNTANNEHFKLLSSNVSKSYYPEFIELIRNYDITGIQESKTDNCDFINIPGYDVYFNNRENLSGRKSGGIALLVKKKYMILSKLNVLIFQIWSSGFRFHQNLR